VSKTPLRCLCCGSAVIAVRGAYEICQVCGWEDDPVQAADPDSRGGANKASLNGARRAWTERHSRPSGTPG
jgi:hypothetical protein